MENDNQQNTYLSLLEDSQNKKKFILDQLIKLTEEQEKLIKSEDIDDKQFNLILDEKDKLIQAIVKLDDGFEQIYGRVKDVLTVNKSRYQSDILRLQKLILEVTDQGVRLQALEKRNKVKMEVYLQKKRKDIKDFKVSNQTVSSYYKNMFDHNTQKSYFFDKKK